MLSNDNNNLNIVKQTNQDLLDYFNDAYIKNLELIQDLKTELFELGVKIEETEKTKELYSFKSNNHRNLFSPNFSEETLVNEKSRILDEQLSDLYSAKDSLDTKIIATETTLSSLQEKIDALNTANASISQLLYGDINEEDDTTSADIDSFEFVEVTEDSPTATQSATDNDSLTPSYNILMLQEYQNNKVATILHTIIKQQIINNNHKAEVLNWLLNSDLGRARLTLQEMHNASATLVDEIDHVIDMLNYNVDTKQPIWLMIDNLVAHYRDAHPDCIIEAGTECSDYEINFHPIITISLISMLKELFNNIFDHSNANRVTARVYISSHIIDVYINDNGVGINPDYLSTSPWYSGLHKVHELVKQLDGKIKIDGDLITGTNVRFSFPVTTTR